MTGLPRRRIGKESNEDAREDSFPCLLQVGPFPHGVLIPLGIPGLVDHYSSLHLCPHMKFSLQVCVFPLLKGLPVIIDEGPTLLRCYLSIHNYLCNDSISKQGQHSEVLGRVLIWADTAELGAYIFHIYY